VVTASWQARDLALTIREVRRERRWPRPDCGSGFAPTVWV
jgi:hypothetical protein